jgi:hypothetical protein
VAKQSLAAQSGAVAVPELKMPAIFGQTPANPMEGKAWAPYISFAHPKRTDEWKSIVAKYKQADEGDMYFHKDGVPTAVPTWRGMLLTYRQYWAKTNAAGEVLKTSFKETPEVAKEHVESVVLVLFDDRIEVANFQVRTTKCPILKGLSDALAEAQTPEWAEKSPAHKETLVVAQPFARFYGTVTLGPTRTGKGSGMPYRPGRVDITPTGPAEWRLLKAFQEDPKAQEQLDKAAASFQKRVAEIEEKAK